MTQYKYPWQALQEQRKKPAKKYIARRCDKGIVNDRIYAVLRKDFLLDNPFCQIQRPGKCSIIATEVHHKKGRGRYQNEVSTFFACCIHCHRWAEENPAEAKELGFSVSRLNK